MTIRRLFLIELEKLIRSSVFWVAPIVLAFFLALMLFGFEVYAAKNGVTLQHNLEGDKELAAQIGTRFTGSAVISTYSVIHRFANNILIVFLPSQSKLQKNIVGNVSTGGARFQELQAEPGTISEFDYWSNFFKHLFNPNPLPKPECDCTDENRDNESLDISSLFIGTAHAAPWPALKAPAKLNSKNTFMERLAIRLEWLMEPVILEDLYIDRSRFNGLRFTYLSLYFAYIFVFPLITISVVAQMFAGEFTEGTIKTSLLRPIKRSSLLQAKLLVIGVYLSALILLFVLSALLIGVLFAGYGNLVIDSDLLGNKGKGTIILGDGAVLLLMASAFVAAISFFPLVALAVLLSYIKPETATVIGIISVVYFILFTLGGLPLFEDIRFLFFTTYMDAWTLIFQTPFATAEFVFKITVMALMACGALLLADYIFTKKDVYS